MELGQTVRVTKTKEGKNSNTIKINNRPGIIYAVDKFKITVEFNKNGQAIFRESYNQADIIEGIVKIEIKKGKEWVTVDKSYFK
ncbi:hypothetical protein [Clostridium beijerinckii]|uniref:hypothetical protein n=1 Tax=Clostridium beijerinckii TaxID=1520 RepID=UPI00055DE0C8|nr:hypothetical protein [Clostridium beijerinckii]